MTLHAKFDLRLIEAQEADDSYKMSGCNCDQRIKHSLKYSSTTCRVPSWPLQLARPFGSLTWLWNWRQGPLNVWALHEQVEHLNCMRDQLLTIAVAQNPFPFSHELILTVGVLFQISRWEAYEFKKRIELETLTVWWENIWFLWSLAIN